MLRLAGSNRVSGHFIRAIFKVALSGSDSVKYLKISNNKRRMMRLGNPWKW